MKRMILCKELEILVMMEKIQIAGLMLIEKVFFVLVLITGLIEKDKLNSR